MEYSVLKGASYILIHTPDMVINNGTSPILDSKHDIKFKDKCKKSLRRYKDVLSYLPNQVYIGNTHPKELAKYSFPWHDKKIKIQRFGKFGEIMPQDEFIGFIRMCDSFDLINLTCSFTNKIKSRLLNHKIIRNLDIARLKNGLKEREIKTLIDEKGALPIYDDDVLVGCVKRAHDKDINLSAQIIFGNLVTKASGALALMHLLKNQNLNHKDIEYVIECSEEACGDFNQRGGGSFAKSIAEACELSNATGCDVRGFCAGPTHAIIQGAALVSSDVYKNVVVVSGGSISKLGFTAKQHIENDMPVLEDVVGAFAVLISKNDRISPKIRIDTIGKHTVGTGSSPQSMMASLISRPLDKLKLTVSDIDVYSVEMQNPEITKVSGVGDVPLANYKMIGYLGVERGEIKSDDITNFIQSHGLCGWAPTQGHIASGVPYIGFAIEELKNKSINRVMVIGKGSLFLGRMTNLFDGVSFVLEKNDGKYYISDNMSSDDINIIIAKAMKSLADEILKDME